MQGMVKRRHNRWLRAASTVRQGRRRDPRRSDAGLIHLVEEHAGWAPPRNALEPGGFGVLMLARGACLLTGGRTGRSGNGRSGNGRDGHCDGNHPHPAVSRRRHQVERRSPAGRSREAHRGLCQHDRRCRSQ